MSKATSDVFISYSTDAKPWAKKISDSLEDQGVATWTDFKSIKPGQRVVDEMHRALDKAKCFLIVVGPKKQPGEWQDREWQGALQQTWINQSKRIIPVLINNVTPPPFLQNWGAVRVQSGKADSSWMGAIFDAVTGNGSEGNEAAGKPSAQQRKAFKARLREIESVAKQMRSLQER